MVTRRERRQPRRKPFSVRTSLWLLSRSIVTWGLVILFSIGTFVLIFLLISNIEQAVNTLLPNSHNFIVSLLLYAVLICLICGGCVSLYRGGLYLCTWIEPSIRDETIAWQCVRSRGHKILLRRRYNRQAKARQKEAHKKLADFDRITRLHEACIREITKTYFSIPLLATSYLNFVDTLEQQATPDIPPAVQKLLADNTSAYLKELSTEQERHLRLLITALIAASRNEETRQKRR